MTQPPVNRILFWGMLSLYFLFVGYEILHSDYLFTDEAYMLWHHKEHGLIFTYFYKQGRFLTGWLEQLLFAACGTAANVKYIRLLSLVECGLTLVFLFYMLKRLQRKGLALSDHLICLTVAFVAASLSTTIWIGWAVCTEIFIPMLLSLVAGTLLSEAVMKPGSFIRVPMLITLSVLALGVTALFFYPPAYPFLLLPFFLLYLSQKDGKIGKPLVVGGVYFFAGLVIYFALFKYSLKTSGMTADDRTALAFNPLERLSFFFSSPLNQAFNGNAFFDARSLLSQAVFPVLFLCWIGSVLYTSRKGDRIAGPDGHGRRQAIRGPVSYILGMLAFWILGYLPMLVAQESFGPYRTMQVLSVMIFLLLADTVLPLIPAIRTRTILSFLFIGILLMAGAYHYKVYLADPLSKEYRLIRTAVHNGYGEPTREIIFLRTSDHGFEESLGIGSYKDEFGMPSTSKDWTPEPLVKTLIWEKTGNRQRAAGLRLIQFADTDTAARRVLSAPACDSILVIDVPRLLKDGNQSR